MGWGWGDINIHIDINMNIDIHIIIIMNIEDYKKYYLLFIRLYLLGIPYWVVPIGIHEKPFAGRLRPPAPSQAPARAAPLLPAHSRPLPPPLFQGPFAAAAVGPGGGTPAEGPWREGGG